MVLHDSQLLLLLQLIQYAVHVLLGHGPQPMHQIVLGIPVNLHGVHGLVNVPEKMILRLVLQLLHKIQIMEVKLVQVQNMKYVALCHVNILGIMNGLPVMQKQANRLVPL